MTSRPRALEIEARMLARKMIDLEAEAQRAAEDGNLDRSAALWHVRDGLREERSAFLREIWRLRSATIATP